MKISSQTSSTQFHTPKNEGFKPFMTHSSEQKVMENNHQVDFEKFQRQMNKIQEKILLKEIEKYQNKNLQKQFPPLLKQLQQRSQKFITLQNRYNTIKEQFTKEETKLDQVEQEMEQQKEHLEQRLFELESEELLKHEYEKQLILGMIDCSEEKIKQLMEQRQEKNEQKQIAMEQRNQLLNQIQAEKQIILKLAIKKAQIQEELNFVKCCQIQPMHLIKEKSLKSYQAKVKYFEERFMSVEGQSTGLIQNYCQNLQSLNDKEFGESSFDNQSKCINDGLLSQQKIMALQKNLNTLTSAKLQITQNINIQLVKNEILTKQIDLKNTQAQKYQQLLTNVQNQSYCIEQIQDNYQITMQVVKDLQLEEKVNNQLHQNEVLKKKLNELVEKLNKERQANLKLNRLLSQVKIDHQMRTNKMIAESDILKSKLETKKKIYENKIELNNEPVISVFTRQKSFEKINYGSGKTKLYKEKKQEVYSSFSGIKSYFQEEKIHCEKKIINAFQNINLVNNRVQPSKQLPQREQSLQSRMSELRGRLMRKFQEAENMKR